MAEVIQYLGAIARNQDAEHVHWTDQSEVVRASRPASNTDGVNQHSVFRVSNGLSTRTAISVEHRGEAYYVGDTSNRDHSLQALSVLSELLATARSVSDIPLQQTLQVIP
jgi:hypothetical protein